MRVRWSDKHEVFHPTERAHRGQSTSLTQQTTTVLEQSPTSPWVSPNDDAPETIEPCLDTMPVLYGDEDWLSQALEPTTPEYMLFDGDSSHAITQPTTTSDKSGVLLVLEKTNASVDAVDPPELLGAQSPSREAQAEDVPSPHESCSIDPPPLQQIPRPVNNYATVFVEYYFKHVAPILSLYDSNMNPFRSTVSRHWGSSALIYFTLQSMAAARLSNMYPQMSSVGAGFRQKAIALFLTLDEAAVDEQGLLALFMRAVSLGIGDLGTSNGELFHLLVAMKPSTEGSPALRKIKAPKGHGAPSDPVLEALDHLERQRGHRQALRR
ncbi:C6 zinc finger protein [Colletotrichum plurivorum]|uniref:C6 zinc finger protein n=1 Tax=Colletotrichum plurivorum TaxID=2175906 RepID=A0A8H6MY53_9PEZI|nr:C6 zinc finger protein [Colletotrichum plurivorum]